MAIKINNTTVDNVSFNGEPVDQVNFTDLQKVTTTTWCRAFNKNTFNTANAVVYETTSNQPVGNLSWSIAETGDMPSTERNSNYYYYGDKLQEKVKITAWGYFVWDKAYTRLISTLSSSEAHIVTIGVKTRAEKNASTLNTAPPVQVGVTTFVNNDGGLMWDATNTANNNTDIINYTLNNSVSPAHVYWKYTPMLQYRYITDQDATIHTATATHNAVELGEDNQSHSQSGSFTLPSDKYFIDGTLYNGSLEHYTVLNNKENQYKLSVGNRSTGATFIRPSLGSFTAETTKGFTGMGVSLKRGTVAKTLGYYDDFKSNVTYWTTEHLFPTDTLEITPHVAAECQSVPKYQITYGRRCDTHTKTFTTSLDPYNFTLNLENVDHLSVDLNHSLVTESFNVNDEKDLIVNADTVNNSWSHTSYHNDIITLHNIVSKRRYKPLAKCTINITGNKSYTLKAEPYPSYKLYINVNDGISQYDVKVIRGSIGQWCEARDFTVPGNIGNKEFTVYEGDTYSVINIVSKRGAAKMTDITDQVIGTSNRTVNLYPKIVPYHYLQMTANTGITSYTVAVTRGVEAASIGETSYTTTYDSNYIQHNPHNNILLFEGDSYTISNIQVLKEYYDYSPSTYTGNMADVNIPIALTPIIIPTYSLSINLSSGINGYHLVINRGSYSKRKWLDDVDTDFNQSRSWEVCEGDTYSVSVDKKYRSPHYGQVTPIAAKITKSSVTHTLTAKYYPPVTWNVTKDQGVNTYKVQIIRGAGGQDVGVGKVDQTFSVNQPFTLYAGDTYNLNNVHTYKEYYASTQTASGTIAAQTKNFTTALTSTKIPVYTLHIIKDPSIKEFTLSIDRGPEGTRVEQSGYYSPSTKYESIDINVYKGDKYHIQGIHPIDARYYPVSDISNTITGTQEIIPITLKGIPYSKHNLTITKDTGTESYYYSVLHGKIGQAFGEPNKDPQLMYQGTTLSLYKDDIYKITGITTFQGYERIDDITGTMPDAAKTVVLKPTQVGSYKLIVTTNAGIIQYHVAITRGAKGQAAQAWPIDRTYEGDEEFTVYEGDSYVISHVNVDTTKYYDYPGNPITGNIGTTNKTIALNASLIPVYSLSTSFGEGISGYQLQVTRGTWGKRAGYKDQTWTQHAQFSTAVYQGDTYRIYNVTENTDYVNVPDQSGTISKDVTIHLTTTKVSSVLLQITANAGVESYRVDIKRGSVAQSVRVTTKDPVVYHASQNIKVYKNDKYTIDTVVTNNKYYVSSQTASGTINTSAVPVVLTATKIPVYNATIDCSTNVTSYWYEILRGTDGQRASANISKHQVFGSADSEEDVYKDDTIKITGITPINGKYQPVSDITQKVGTSNLIIPLNATLYPAYTLTIAPDGHVQKYTYSVTRGTISKAFGLSNIGSTTVTSKATITVYQGDTYSITNIIGKTGYNNVANQLNKLVTRSITETLQPQAASHFLLTITVDKPSITNYHVTITRSTEGIAAHEADLDQVYSESMTLPIYRGDSYRIDNINTPKEYYVYTPDKYEHNNIQQNESRSLTGQKIPTYQLAITTNASIKSYYLAIKRGTDGQRASSNLPSTLYTSSKSWTVYQGDTYTISSIVVNSQYKPLANRTGAIAAQSVSINLTSSKYPSYNLKLTRGTHVNNYLFRLVRGSIGQQFADNINTIRITQNPYNCTVYQGDHYYVSDIQVDSGYNSVDNFDGVITGSVEKPIETTQIQLRLTIEPQHEGGHVSIWNHNKQLKVNEKIITKNTRLQLPLEYGDFIQINIKKADTAYYSIGYGGNRSITVPPLSLGTYGHITLKRDASCRAITSSVTGNSYDWENYPWTYIQEKINTPTSGTISCQPINSDYKEENYSIPYGSSYPVILCKCNLVYTVTWIAKPTIQRSTSRDEYLIDSFAMASVYNPTNRPITIREPEYDVIIEDSDGIEQASLMAVGNNVSVAPRSTRSIYVAQTTFGGNYYQGEEIITENYGSFYIDTPDNTGLVYDHSWSSLTIDTVGSSRD